MGWFLTGGALLQNCSRCPGKLQLLGTCAAEARCCRRLAQGWKNGETLQHDDKTQKKKE